MKSFLKYFISILIVAISFIAVNAEEPYHTTDKEDKTASIELNSYYTDSPELESEFYLPPQSLLSSVTFRQNSFSKRANNNHRNNFSFTEEGNPIHKGEDISTLNASYISQTLFTNSFHRLISFGKLII